MQKVVLVRYGEIMLKGLNRQSFVNRLAANIRRAIAPVGLAHVGYSQGRVYIEPRQENYNALEAAMKARNIFGVVSVSIAYKSGKTRADVKDSAAAAVRDYMDANKPVSGDGKYAFKVESKRADKSYERISPVISRETGDDVTGMLPELKVDVNNPQFILYVEIRENASYAYTEKISGFGGLPIGSNGKALLLLSGGIDSPVAGFMMAKRGVAVDAVHFYSHPFTSERSKDKVIRLSEILSEYFGRINLYVVPFTDLQLTIRDNCRDELLTIVTRRAMMFISDILAGASSSQALITGESMGQVASQTIMGLAVTNDAAQRPVFRPLIGMDKSEIIECARNIGTYDTSILPYEDCCTLFTPKRPKTKPKLDEVLAEEAKIPNYKSLIANAAENAEIIKIL